MAIIPPIILLWKKHVEVLQRDWCNFGELEKLQISKKDKNDFLSSADLRASESIDYHLNKDRPDFLQIDEETFKRRLRKIEGDTPVFISDPLDGTKTIHGNGCFAVTIGLVHKKEVIAGVTYNH